MSYTKLVKSEPNPFRREVPQNIKDYEERFTDKVAIPSGKHFWEDTDEWFTRCWLWTGPVQEDGQRFIRVYGAKVPIHRFAWLLWKDDIPEGLFPRPTECGDMACVSRHHMEVVPRGAMTEKKLDGKTLELICFLYRDKEKLEHGWTHAKLAAKFEVSEWMIRRVIEGDNDRLIHRHSQGQNEGVSV